MDNPAATKLAQTITVEMLPQLRTLYGQLLLLHEEWQANAITDAVNAAAQASELLAGYDPATWGAWGVVFNGLLAFLDTPLAEGQPTPKQIMLKTYTATTQPIVYATPRMPGDE